MGSNEIPTNSAPFPNLEPNNAVNKQLNNKSYGITSIENTDTNSLTHQGKINCEEDELCGYGIQKNDAVKGCYIQSPSMNKSANAFIHSGEYRDKKLKIQKIERPIDKNSNEKNGTDYVNNIQPSQLTTLQSINTKQNGEIRLNNDEKLDDKETNLLLENVQNISNENIMNQAKIQDRVEINDNLFIKILKRSVTAPSQPVKKFFMKKETIYSNLKIYSKTKINFEGKKYYKFPFNDHTINDGGLLYTEIFNEWRKALKDIFFRYKNESLCFFILFENIVLRFINDTVETSVELIDLFMKNDICFTGRNNKIYLTGIDISLAVDLFMNMDYGKKRALPFILSDCEFENGIVYKTRLNNTGTVLKSGKTTYCYVIEGYFWHKDYEDLLEMEIDAEND